MKKNMKRTARPTLAESAAGHRPVAPRKSQDAAVKRALAAADAANPLQGAIRLPLAKATAEEIAALTSRAMNGLTANAYYTLPDILASLTSAWNAQSALAYQVQAAREHLATLLAAQMNETALGRDILRSAARACESADSSDEALLSVGWELRRSRTPSSILPAPAGLTLKSTDFPGVMCARWRRVPLFRVYEIQCAVPEDSTTSPDWSQVPVANSSSGTHILPAAPVGRVMHLRVRTVGTKGPGPWGPAVSTLVL